MQDSAQQIFARYLRDRPKADIAIGISQGMEHKYAFLSGAKSPYAGIDKHSIFEVGSVSKTFTAVLLEKAVFAGYTELSAPVHELVPEIREFIPSSMTIYQLAVHTSGLPYDFPPNMTRKARKADRDPWALLTREDLFRYISTAKTDIPGSKWRYSNIGYAVLAIALEKVYGAPYAEVVRSHVFEPLNMTDSISSGDAIKCATSGHCGNDVSPNSESELLFGPGDVRASIHDILAYADAAMHPDLAPYERFGEHLFEPAEEEKPAKVRQGLGWALIDEDRGWLVMASGATCGFSCSVMFSPRRRKCVAVLSNHVDIGGIRDLVRAYVRKGSTVQGGTQLLYNAL